jgi:hypothetical protein
MLGLAIVVGSAAALAALLYHPAPPPLAEQPHAQALARWNALPETERGWYLQCYQALVERPDVAEVRLRARTFAALSTVEQDRLGSVQSFLQDWLERLPAPRRLALLALHERARAEAIFHVLETDSPQAIRELRERLSGGS